MYSYTILFNLRTTSSFSPTIRRVGVFKLLRKLIAKSTRPPRYTIAEIVSLFSMQAASIEAAAPVLAPK